MQETTAILVHLSVLQSFRRLLSLRLHPHRRRQHLNLRKTAASSDSGLQDPFLPGPPSPVPPRRPLTTSLRLLCLSCPRFRPERLKNLRLNLKKNVQRVRPFLTRRLLWKLSSSLCHKLYSRK